MSSSIALGIGIALLASCGAKQPADTASVKPGEVAVHIACETEQQYMIFVRPGTSAPGDEFENPVNDKEWKFHASAIPGMTKTFGVLPGDYQLRLFQRTEVPNEPEEIRRSGTLSLHAELGKDIQVSCHDPGAAAAAKPGALEIAITEKTVAVDKPAGGGDAIAEPEPAQCTPRGAPCEGRGMPCCDAAPVCMAWGPRGQNTLTCVTVEDCRRGGAMNDCSPTH